MSPTARPSLVTRARTALARVIAPDAPKAARGTVLRGIYNVAKQGRLTMDWATSVLDADSDLRGDTQKIRARLREMVANNAYAARWVAACEENILGADGIALQARIPNTRGGVNEIASRAVELHWWRWGHAAGVHGESWRDIERQLVRGWKTEGEVFLELVPNRQFGPYGFAVQVLEADLLDDKHDEARLANGHRVAMGVERTDTGRVVAYHFWTEHPNAYQRTRRERRRVPADRIIHLREIGRPGASRGVSRLATVATALRHLDAMQEATLVLNRLAAARGGFWERKAEDALALASEAGEEAMPSTVEPGEFGIAPDGYTLKMVETGQPTPEYDAFTRNVLRQVAAGLGIAYTTLTGDLSQANYSSARVGMLSERDAWKLDQQRLAQHVHQRVYEAWLRQAALMGAVEGITGDLARYTEVHWQARGWPWVDPQKDIDAAAREVELGLSSLTRLAQERGRDFLEVVLERKREQEILATHGVAVTLGTSAPPAASVPSPDPVEEAA